MKNEVNRALVAKKKSYVCPLVEMTQVSLKTGVLGVTSTPPPPPAPGRKIY